MGPKFLLAFLSLGIIVGLAEVVIGILAPRQTVERILRDHPSMYQPHEVLFIGLIPGFEGRLREYGQWCGAFWDQDMHALLHREWLETNHSSSQSE